MDSLVDNRTVITKLEHDNQLRILRTVAAFELTKGLVVLFAACGFLFLVRREDPFDIADGLLRLLHISPDRHFAQVFLDWADTLTEAKLFAVGGAAIAYSILRFAEAFGLWKARAWAEWIALISGTLYVPFEIYALVHSASLFHIIALLVNLAIVFYMGYVLKTSGSIHFPRHS